MAKSIAQKITGITLAEWNARGSKGVGNGTQPETHVVTASGTRVGLDLKPVLMGQGDATRVTVMRLFIREHGGSTAAFEFPATLAGAKSLRSLLTDLNAAVQGGGNAATYGTPDAIASNLLPVALGGNPATGIKGVRRGGGSVASDPASLLARLGKAPVMTAKARTKATRKAANAVNARVKRGPKLGSTAPTQAEIPEVIPQVGLHRTAQDTPVTA